MNIAAVREIARERIKENKFNIWKAYLVPIVISLAVDGAFLILFAILNLNKDQINVAKSIPSALCNIALLPVYAGIYAYLLKFVRNHEFDLSYLTKFYPMFGKLFLIYLLSIILVAVGFVCLIIPGIIIALGLSMVFYVAVDSPHLTATECIAKSWEMMKGHKREYFLLQLSFIGWVILTPFTLGLLAIWLVPYMNTANTIFYNNVVNKIG